MTTFSKATRERLKAAERRMRKPEVPFQEMDLKEMFNVPPRCTRAFHSNRYCVMVFDNEMTNKGLVTRVMVQTWDDRPILNHWSEMQRIKNEIFGEETVAIEFYPKESELINHFNVYWMWIFPEGVLPKVNAGQ